MDYRVEVFRKTELPDGRTEQLKSDFARLGVAHLKKISLSDLYFLRGEISASELDLLCQRLLADPIVQDYTWRRLDRDSPGPQAAGLALEVGLPPGVTDRVADNLIKGARVIGMKGLCQAATARRYVFSGEFTRAELGQIARELWCNEIIHVYRLGHLKHTFTPPAEASDLVETVVLRSASGLYVSVKI